MRASRIPPTLSLRQPLPTIPSPPQHLPVHNNRQNSPATSTLHRSHSSHRLSMSSDSVPRFSVTQACGSDCNGDNTLSSGDVDYAEIVVVRHGETEWNADGRIQGHLDVELNENGRQQAAAVAERLSRERKLSAIYSSDLKRAFETAQIIAAACGRLDVIQYPDLRERNLGELQGHSLREALSMRPEAYKAFLSHHTDQELPGGGESIDQLYQRCTSSLRNISQKHKGQRVVVVTHGGVIRSLHRRACPSGRPGKILNTSVNIFNLFDGGKWLIKSWGDVSHLEETGFLKTGFGGDKTSG